MKITNINITNLKGRTASINLAAMTVITGRNSTGKTAVRDGILLGLLGTHPNHPKTAQGIFGLSSASEMVVQLTTELGTIERKWTQKGKRVMTEATGADNLPETPIVMLDAAEFLGASDDARLKAIFALAKVEVAIPQVAARIKAKAGMQAAVVEAIIEPQGDEASNPQRWIDGAIARLQEAEKNAKQEIKRLTQTAQGIAQVSATEEAVDAGQVREEAQRLAEARREAERQRAEIQTKIGAAQKAKAAVEKWETDVAALRELAKLAPAEPKDEIKAKGIELRKRYESAQQAGREAELAWERETRLRREAADLKADIESAERETAGISILQSTIMALDAKRKEIGDRLTAISAASDQSLRDTAEIDALENGIPAMDAEIRKRSEEFSGLAQATHCPTCGTSGNSWKESLLGRMEEEIRLLKDKRTNAMLEINSRKSEMESIRRDIRESREAIEQQAVAERAERIRASAQIARLEATAEQVGKWKSSLAEIMAKSNPEMTKPETPNLTPITTEIDALRRLWDAAQAKESLAVLESNAPSVPDIAALEAALIENEQVLAKNESEREALRAKITQASNQEADAKRLQDAQDARKKAEVEAENIKAANDQAKEERSKLSAQAFGPLLETVARFTRGILPTSIEMHNGEIGRFENGSWIALRCFSGTHLAVTAAGLQAALGAQSPAKIVIVDELGRFDVENKAKFAENIRAAIDAGTIDQFVGIDVTKKPWSELAIKGLHVHEMAA